jgi:hypothetical protein
MDDSLRTQRSWSAWRPQLRNAQAASADRRTFVVVAHGPADLSPFIPAWEELAAAALEPNVFYEHWMLIPALEGLRLGEDVSVVLVLIRDSHNPKLPPKLGALFPLQRLRKYKLIPAATYRLWRHQHCYLATPLVRADAARECLTEFFWWLLSNDGGAARLVELWGVRGDGPFHQALVDVSNELGLMSWVSESHTRGLLRKRLGANEPNALDVPGELRRILRRKERRLNERGALKHVVLGPDGDVSRWIEEFVSLEARGWKGEGGSALASSAADRRYFAGIVDSAFRRGRLLMTGIDFDGRPIARRCGFTAGEGSFAFKTAYDEEFARFSPGVMLEVDNLKQFYALPELRWMDSCTASDNFTINRLWNDRITIQSLAIGSGSWSELVLSTVPMLRWLRRRVPGGRWDRD